jgi:hypothetical protein
MSWVKYSRGSLHYAGRIDRQPYLAWTATPEGAATIEAVAREMPFSLLGRRHAARRVIWRELAAAARDEATAKPVQRELDAYFERLTALAFSPHLPGIAPAGQRLVVVPRSLLNGLACRGVAERLGAAEALAGLSGGDAIRSFFLEQLVAEIDRAFISPGPSPRRPVLARDGWASAGVNTTFVWRLPLSGPAWPGHHFMVQVQGGRMTRTQRKAVEAGIPQLEASLRDLSRLDRDETLRRAAVFGR